MKKTLLIKGFILLIASIPLFGIAQKRDASGAISHKFPGIGLIELNATCDSIGWPPPPTYDVTWYSLGNGGYISGTNTYGDIGKGNYFDLSASTGTYMLRAILGLGPVNSKVDGDFTRQIPIKVYDGTSGTPGAVIGTFPATLQEMVDRSFDFTLVVFPVAISLPASKKIFISIDITNLAWGAATADAAVKDTLTLLSTADGDPTVPLSWEQWSDNSWHTLESSWNNGPGTPGLKLNHHLYPLVSTEATGCNTLPVTFGQFTAKQSPLGIDLKWQTWTETKNDRFEVEKSTDGMKFLSIGTVKTKAVNGESQGLKSYQFTDPSPVNGVNLYRIRQVDKDGSYNFTKTVKVLVNSGDDNQLVKTYYPNPAKDRMYIQLASGIREVESIRFTDASGKILISQKPAVTPDGVMTVSTIGLKGGLHFATLTLPDGRQTTIKVIKD